MKAAKELRAGVVGLGHIGGGVATSLANRGRAITASYDVVPDLWKKHPGAAEQSATPAEVAAKADVIMIAVWDYNQCLEVIAGENGLLSNAHEDMVLCVLSTIEVEHCKRLHEICREKGVGFLDIGVTPGGLADKNGLVAMIGGDEADYQLALPVLEDWSAAPIYCGPCGAGMACKIARNMNSYGFWGITAEAFRLVVAAGVDPKKYIQVLHEADKVDNMVYKFIEVRSMMPDHKLPEQARDVHRFMEKDLHASKELSDALGLELPVRDELLKHCRSTFDLED